MTIQEFLLPDAVGEVRFRGEILADRRWHNGDSVRRRRWTDMILYRVRDSAKKTKYIIHITARSAVYHRIGGPCVERSSSPWRRITVGELYSTDRQRFDELVPCDRYGCAPPRLQAEKDDPDDIVVAEDDEVIGIEVDKPRILTARSASEVPHRIYANSGKISELAALLLEDAMRKDSDLARVMGAPREID